MFEYLGHPFHLQLIYPHTVFISFTELYYGNEAITLEQAQSFTCPYCGKMGLTETTLQEHVTSEHSDSSVEVVSYATFYLMTPGWDIFDCWCCKFKGIPTGPPLVELSPRIVNTSGYMAFLFHFVVEEGACSLIIFTQRNTPHCFIQAPVWSQTGAV